MSSLHPKATFNEFAWMLSQSEQVMICPRMILEDSSDHGVALFEGAGRVVFHGFSSIEFEIDCRALRGDYSVGYLRSCMRSSRDPGIFMRLLLFDQTGREWNAGWIRPSCLSRHSEGVQTFVIRGHCSSLLTSVPAEQLTWWSDQKCGGVELCYAVVPDELSAALPTDLQSQPEGVRQLIPRKRSLEVLGCEIELSLYGSLSPVASAAQQRDLPAQLGMHIQAKTNASLNHPYLENWLSEPFTALFGELVFPRLMARHVLQGTRRGSTISVRVVPANAGALTRSLGGCICELGRQGRYSGNATPTLMWDFYVRYVTHVASHQGADGRPEFEANPLTRMQYEVIQAAEGGSFWVLAVSLAIAVEGLVLMDPAFKHIPADFTAQEIQQAKSVVRSLPNSAMVTRLLNSLGQMKRASALRYLMRQQEMGNITSDQVQAWKDLRNRLVHGTLFAPWTPQEDRDKLRALSTLFYRLTALRVNIPGSPVPK